MRDRSGVISKPFRPIRSGFSFSKISAVTSSWRCEDSPASSNSTPTRIDRIDTSTAHNSYAEPRGELTRRLAGAKLSRIIGRTVVPRKAGQFIFEKFFLRRAPKPPIDPRARDLLCALYDPDVTELEKTLGYPLPQLRRSWRSA
jgi:hypothetical protein